MGSVTWPVANWGVEGGTGGDGEVSGELVCVLCRMETQGEAGSGPG